MFITGLYCILFLCGTCAGHEELTIKEMLQRIIELLEYMALETTVRIPIIPEKNYTCQPCLDGWIPYKTSCYLFVETKFTYSEARRNCLSVGAELVHVDDWDENNFIVTHLKNLREQAHWMGLTDIENEGHFKWENGDDQTFSDWSQGQPNNYDGNEDCAEFRRGINYKWNDLPCSTRTGSICEM